MQTTVRDLLRQKTEPLKFVREDNSVFDVVEQLLEHNISAVLVLRGADLVGIVTERDVARNVVLDGRTAKETAASEIMTRNVLFVRAEQTIEECMALMTERRIRHLPVMEGTRLIGILSIRDLVSALVSQKQFVIEQLENYITGRI
jgi:CBS domain-containing protein